MFRLTVRFSGLILLLVTLILLFLGLVIRGEQWWSILLLSAAVMGLSAII